MFSFRNMKSRRLMIDIESKRRMLFSNVSEVNLANVTALSYTHLSSHSRCKAGKAPRSLNREYGTVEGTSSVNRRREDPMASVDLRRHYEVNELTTACRD